MAEEKEGAAASGDAGEASKPEGKEKRAKRELRGPSQQALGWFWTGIAAAIALCFLWRLVRYRYCDASMFSALGVALILRRMAQDAAKSGK